MQQDLTKGPILSQLLKFTIPLFIGNVFQQLYNMCDSIIVGRFVGQGALAAVGSTGTLMFLMIGFAIGNATGFSVLTSQRYGAGDEDGVKVSVANGVLLAVIISVILTAVFTLLVPDFLRLMNTPEDIYQEAYDYIHIIAEGLTATIFYNLLSCFLRAVGNSKAPLFFLVFSACLNVVLDLTLIIIFHMGTAGAALATVLSQAISAVLCLIYIMARVRELIPGREQWKLNKDASIHQIRMGGPMALQFAITASGTMVMQSAINLFGSTAVAAFTAASKVQNLLTQGLLSLGQAMTTYCGQNYGSGNAERIRKGVNTALKIAVVYSLAAAVLVYFLLPQMMSIFFSGDTDIGQLLPWARQYAYLSMCFFIPLGFIFVCRNSMQGCGYALLPMMAGVVEFFARTIMALIGMRTHSYILSVACDPAAWLCAGIFTFFAFRWTAKQIRKKLG